MEFLATIATLITAASKVLDVAWYHGSERKKIRRQLSENHRKLVAEIVNEGRKIQSYLEFDKLITQIDGAIAVILQSDRRTEQHDVFWENIELTHQQLQDAVNVSLQNFDESRFEQFHQGLVAAGRPILQGQIRASQALFDARQRERYVAQLQQALPQVGQMKGFASLIIEGVSRALTNFGGP